MEGITLRGRLIRYVPSPDGVQADIALIEPNGEEYEIRCLCRPTGTEIGGDDYTLRYLNERYSPEAVWRTASRVVEYGSS
jgi:hypothetical protein